MHEDCIYVISTLSLPQFFPCLTPICEGYIYIYIHLCLFRVSNMCVFSADHLVLDNLSRSSSLEKTGSH